MSTAWAVFIGVAPSIGMGILLWAGLRAVVRADRNERAAQARLDEAEEAAAAGDGQAGR